MLGRGAGLGSGSCPNSACTATFGVAGPQPAMGLAGARGRAAWVLAGGLLAAALALPAGPRDRGRPPTGPNPLRRPLGAQLPPDPPAAPGAGPEREAQVRSARPDSVPSPGVWLHPRRRRGGPLGLGKLPPGKRGRDLSRMRRVLLSGSRWGQENSPERWRQRCGWRLRAWTLLAAGSIQLRSLRALCPRADRFTSSVRVSRSVTLAGSTPEGRCQS